METPVASGLFHSRAAYHHLELLAGVDHQLNSARAAELADLLDRTGSIVEEFLALRRAEQNRELVNRLGLSE